MGSEPKRYLPQPQTSCATTLESPHKASAILSSVKYGTFVAKPSGRRCSVENPLCQGHRRSPLILGHCFRVWYRRREEGTNIAALGERPNAKTVLPDWDYPALFINLLWRTPPGKGECGRASERAGAPLGWPSADRKTGRGKGECPQWCQVLQISWHF